MNQEKQPEALGLADKLENSWAGIANTAALAAVELRRLHAENEQLKTALKAIATIEVPMNGADWEEFEEAQNIAKSALKETTLKS